ncbi:MAG: sulfatase-like hydrolase/transferase [Pseudomonadales bacterium]|nr:sulfatase-like hydrolase/transferase [Pseudomonadales bacterium]
MKRNILFITTDQMRYDAIGCNGGRVARTPHINKLSNSGINYRRAHNQNVVCMPARATMITGQHVATHGVWMNGVCLPEDSQTVAHVLKQHDYNTALVGKAHFEPWLGDPDDFFENRMAALNSTGPHRGFDHMELANHFFEGHSHYDRWMEKNHKAEKAKCYQMTTAKGQNTAGRGDTQAVQVWPTDIPREIYHTDWVADRTLDWLSSQSASKPWFCWMSFPDPHHPWDPPVSEMHRVNWRDLKLPELYFRDKSKREAVLEAKPKHWKGYYEGKLWTNLEAPREFVPANLSEEQILEINALIHIENELIDEACGRVFSWLRENGWDDNTDIIFTTDHGELQGDYGLLFKGAYHVDALMRVPLIWRPAPNANLEPAEVKLPVGHVDLAKTFCQIADVEAPPWIEGQPLPESEIVAEKQNRETVLTEWDSEHGPVSLHLKTIYNKSGWLCTTYEKSSLYEGTEGELYNLKEDPGQLVNLWHDSACQAIKLELIEQLYAQLPEKRSPVLERKAPC